MIRGAQRRFEEIGAGAWSLLVVFLMVLAACVAAAAEIPKPKVVCFGDSITKRGYPGNLGTLLGVEAVNAGVAGNTTAQALRRMSKDVLAQKPDVVVIFFGTNDTRVDSEKHVPVEAYEANLVEMTKRCRVAGAKVVLCTLPPINEEAYFQRHEKETFDAAGGLPALLAQYRAAAMRVGKTAQVPVVDLNQILLEHPSWLGPDGVHPSPGGCRTIAKLVAEAVRPLMAGVGSSTDSFAAERREILALASLTEAPAVHPAEGFKSTGTVKAVYYDALPWKGAATKVFAWLGVPEDATGPVPGVVLVHGGGGTAFKEWVEKWNAHGFAAISIAVEGQTDVRTNGKGWSQHAWPGPQRSGIYHDSDVPLRDQWMFHAVADTILANSLLRSLPEVDATTVGVMGISWGGVITSTVMGVDDRFAFAIPTYGCGRLATAGNQYGRSLGDNALYKEAWDPMVRMKRAMMPTLWFSWPEDRHFPLDCQAASYRAAPGPRMVSLIPRMRHGHGPPWNKPDSYAFAKSVVEDGAPWCGQTHAVLKEGTCEVEFASSKPLESAVLVFTTGAGVTGERTWTTTPATLRKTGEGTWAITAPLPEKATAWFVNAVSGGLTVSSDYQETGRSPAEGRSDRRPGDGSVEE